MTQLGSALTRLDPPLRALFVFNSNPAVVAPRSDLVQQGLAREDLFTVVLEQAMTETARYADYLLPATTFLEHPDLYTAYGHFYLSWNEPVMPPQGEARPNTWVFAELARRLSLEEPTLYWNAEDLARSLLASGHPGSRGSPSSASRPRATCGSTSPAPSCPSRRGPTPRAGKIRLRPASTGDPHRA